MINSEDTKIIKELVMAALFAVPIIPKPTKKWVFFQDENKVKFEYYKEHKEAVNKAFDIVINEMKQGNI